MRIGLSVLLENPLRRTGLTTLFEYLVRYGMRARPNDSWVVFAGPGYPWQIDDPAVDVMRSFHGNQRTKRRLFADHLLVPREAKRLKCDVLITTGFVPLHSPLPIAMQMVSMQHANSANGIGGARRLYRGWSAGRGCRLARLIITNSEFAASQIVATYPECSQRLIVSYEGVDHCRFHPSMAPDEAQSLRTQFGLDPGYVLWVSNFYQYKQAELLVRGYALLPASMRKNAPLVMVGGSWDGGKERAQQVAREVGVESDLRMLGWVDDEWLALLYRQAAAFCLASREETFGRCVPEAMACGTPCVVNDIPIMREVTGGHALIVDYKDPEVVAENLGRVLCDEELRLRLREGGILNAARFTFEKLATERLTAVEDLVMGRRFAPISV